MASGRLLQHPLSCQISLHLTSQITPDDLRLSFENSPFRLVAAQMSNADLAAEKKPKRSTGFLVSMGFAVSAAVMLAGLAWAESAGWTFLAAPLERQLSRLAGREVRFVESAPNPTPALPSAPSTINAFSIHFLGGLKLRAPVLWVAAPEWSKAPYVLSAKEIGRAHV